MREETRDLSIGQALDLGCEMAMAGRHLDATGLFRGVLMHEPQNFEAIQRLGSSLFELGRHHEALYWFWRGIKINRRHPMALTNYGLTVAQLGHWDEALPDLERAVHHAERNPLSPEAMALIYNNLGNTLEKMKRYPEALAALDKGIRYNPNDAFPHYNRGIVLLRLNRQREAIDALDRAIAINPNDADAHYNRGMGRLLLGDLRGGFEDYESRLLTTENRVPNLGLPADKKWSGETISGKTILVHCEQGLGDDIQFFRFLRRLLERAPAQVFVMAHSATAPLLDGLAVTVLKPGTVLPAYDHWVALMSLPLMLGVTREHDLPPPWLPRIEGHRLATGGVFRFRSIDILGELEKLMHPAPYVGVCWAGNFLHKNDAHRSIEIETFGRMFDAPCNFVSLQQMRPIDVDAFAALKKQHTDLSDVQTDTLRDLAAVILNLDLVISVDTAVAHLAASLGVPTWILIPKFSTDWRWQLERTDSPWYPSARLIRQQKVGDWASVIDGIRNELSAGIAKTRAA